MATTTLVREGRKLNGDDGHGGNGHGVHYRASPMTLARQDSEKIQALVVA